MKTLLPALFLTFAISACNKKPVPKSAALPENTGSEKLIVLKEGQAVTLMKEGDRELMIAASVVQGKLCVAEVDPRGRSFGVSWKDADTWDTTTTVTDGSNTTMVFDKNGDGYADFRAELTPSGIKRYELQGEAWVQLKPKIENGEQAVDGETR